MKFSTMLNEYLMLRESIKIMSHLDKDYLVKAGNKRMGELLNAMDVMIKDNQNISERIQFERESAVLEYQQSQMIGK